MSGSMSGAQLGALAKSKTSSSALYSNPAEQDDEHTLGAGSSGGWKGGESVDALGGLNLSSAQKPMAFRAPDRAGLGTSTIGTWQRFDIPSWHERYKSD